MLNKDRFLHLLNVHFSAATATHACTPVNLSQYPMQDGNQINCHVLSCISSLATFISEFQTKIKDQVVKILHGLATAAFPSHSLMVFCSSQISHIPFSFKDRRWLLPTRLSPKLLKDVFQKVNVNIEWKD